MHSLHHILEHLHLSKTQKAIAENLIWSVAGKVIALLGGLFVGIVVARYLGPTQYGLMSYVISYVLLFQAFATLGLDAIEIREESRQPEDIPIIIGTAFTLKVVAAAIFIFLVLGTAHYMEADRQSITLIAIYALTIVLNAFNVIRNYFTAIVENRHVVKAEISRTLIGIVIKVICLLLHAPLIWFVAAAMFDVFLLATGYSMAYHSKVGSLHGWVFDKRYARFLLKESFPLMLSSAAIILYQRIDQVMIGQMIDKASVGYYSVASKFVEILIYVPMMLAQTIMPILVSIREKDEQAYCKKGQRFMNFSVWFTLLLSVGMSLLAHPIITLTFGKAYIPSVAVLQILSFKAASLALSNTAGTMLVAEGLQRDAIFRDLIGCVTCIALNYLFLPSYGIIAAAWIAVISNASAGYFADALIPSYRHLFVRQTKALFCGWQSLLSARTLFTK